MDEILEILKYIGKAFIVASIIAFALIFMLVPTAAVGLAFGPGWAVFTFSIVFTVELGILGYWLERY